MLPLAPPSRGSARKAPGKPAGRSRGSPVLLASLAALSYVPPAVAQGEGALVMPGADIWAKAALLVASILAIIVGSVQLLGNVFDFSIFDTIESKLAANPDSGAASADAEEDDSTTVAAIPNDEPASSGRGDSAVPAAPRSADAIGSLEFVAREVVKDNIRVNAVSPGVIVTPFHERYSTPAMLESFKGQIPMNRLGTAEECAGAFVYLASDALSGFVTGQIIEVNGGQLMP